MGEMYMTGGLDDMEITHQFPFNGTDHFPEVNDDEDEDGGQWALGPAEPPAWEDEEDWIGQPEMWEMSCGREGMRGDTSRVSLRLTATRVMILPGSQLCFIWRCLHM